MNHSFNVEIATKYGIEEAILIENIAFWVCKNAVNKKHFYDEHYWTYNSAAAFGKLFPYMNPKTISRKLLELENEGMLISGDYNENRYNRTKWYTITEKALDYLVGNKGESPFSILRNRKLDMSNAEHQKAESTISYINLTDINTSINQEANEPIDNNSKEYVENLVKERIELDRLKEKYPNKKGEIQELYEIIVEMLRSKKETYRLGKEDVISTDVKYAFLCLNFAKIEYILDCLSKNTTKVKNTKAYLQTALFNASKTMNNHYSLDAQNMIHNKFGIGDD